MNRDHTVLHASVWALSVLLALVVLALVGPVIHHAFTALTTELTR